MAVSNDVSRREVHILQDKWGVFEMQDARDKRSTLDPQDTPCRLVSTAARLTDEELLRRVQLLARGEREATVELVAHLVVLDTRRLHLAEGYSSLFGYCVEVLRLAEHAAYNRIEAARASRRFPVVLERLADGSLNLSTLRLLAPHLTPENHERVLGEAAGMSKRDVEQLVARLAPRPDSPSSVRKLPGLRPLTASVALPSVSSPEPSPEPSLEPSLEPSRVSLTLGVPVPPAVVVDGLGPLAQGASRPDQAAPSSTPMSDPLAAPPSASARRPSVAPLSAERYRVQFTVGRETHDNLRLAQELLRREVPDGDPGAIFDRALKLLLEDVARKKSAATSRPRPVRATAAGSRHVPAHVKRAVWLRDAGRCAFVARSGRRCRERAFLEVHHVDPYAIGGESTVSNLSLRCRAHNLHEAERVFGPFVLVRGRGVSREDVMVASPTRPGAS